MSGSSLILSFQQQLLANERLKAEHEKLKHEAKAHAQALQYDQAALAEARRSETRSQEIIAALTEAIEQYAGAAALRCDVEDDGMGAKAACAPGEAGGQREAMIELEQRLALKEGELMAALQQLTALSDARAELAELHASLDEQRAAVRRAQQQARDHEAIAGEYEKKLKGLRDALGKAELDRQRKESDHQRALLEASKKLRSQKQLSDSLQRALQYEQQQQQQAGPASRGVRAVGPPASGVFGRPGPSFSFGR
jgi:hypothetical protein